MADRLDKTVRIVRRSKVTTDDRGRTVWTDPVDSAELELVTTTMLTHMLESDDEEQKQRIRDAASGKDGLLARDVEKNQFEIIDDDDLQAALAADDNQWAAQLADHLLAIDASHAQARQIKADALTKLAGNMLNEICSTSIVDSP